MGTGRTYPVDLLYARNLSKPASFRKGCIRHIVHFADI